MTARCKAHQVIMTNFRSISSKLNSKNLCSSFPYMVSRNFFSTTVNSSISAASPLESTDTITTDDQIRSTSSHLTKVPILSTKTNEIHSGIILSRAPLLTPELHSFEKAFFFYQKRLNERLAIPFTRYFYFKKDTPANLDWKIKVKERGGVPAKELGTYNAYGENAWNDELLVKEKHMVEPTYVINQLVKDSRASVTEDGIVIQDESARVGVKMPKMRITEADQTKNVRRLDRLLDRTLYLVVRNKVTKLWGFPTGELIGKENIHEAAERILVESCGVNMNTWIVGNIPVAYHIRAQPKQQNSSVISEIDAKKESVKEKVIFFSKARIMAGQVDLSNTYFDIDDYHWLTKEETARILPSALFNSVCNAMNER